MIVKHIDKDLFLKKIWDFEANPGEWKFLGDKPAVVDFYASWCGPCRRMGEVLEKLSAEYDGKVDFYKVDTDKESTLAMTFNITSIPALLICPKSGDPGMLVGFRPEEELKKIIVKLI